MGHKRITTRDFQIDVTTGVNSTAPLRNSGFNLNLSIYLEKGVDKKWVRKRSKVSYTTITRKKQLEHSIRRYKDELATRGKGAL